MKQLCPRPRLDHRADKLWGVSWGYALSVFRELGFEKLSFSFCDFVITYFGANMWQKIQQNSKLKLQNVSAEMAESAQMKNAL